MLRLVKEENKSLTKQNRVMKKGSILGLNPFIDKVGIIRVGGCLLNADIGFNGKHPIILPKNHIFVKCLIQCEHSRLMHAGTNLVLSSLRYNYWVVSGKGSIKSRIS